MEHAGNTFLITKKEGRALLAYARRDASRVNLHGIGVCPDCATLAATDGHRAIFATAPGGDPWGWPSAPCPPVVPADTWGSVIKAARAADRISIQVADDGRAAVATLAVVPGHATAESLGDTDPREIGATMVARVRLDNRTPPMAQILPRYEDDDHDTPAAGLIGFNPSYIGALSELGKALHAATPIAWRHRGPHDPGLAVATADDGTIWRVVIMPVRLEISRGSKGRAA